MTEILEAIVEDDRGRVRQLLKADRSLATAVVTQARLFNSKIVHWLYAGDTALHLAAAGHQAEIVRLLLSAGADPHWSGNHRRSSPLHYAADGAVGAPNWNETKQVATIEALLDAGADINAADKNGATALHRAVRTRSAGAVKCLLHRGADPKLKNKPGSTAFHLAVQNTGRGGSGSEAARIGQKQIIREFLACGLKPSMRDGHGKSVLDWVRSDSIRDLLCAGATA